MSDLKENGFDFGGIQPPHLIFYHECIRFNCEAAMHSVEFIVSFIDMTNETNGKYEMTGKLQNEVLDHLQNLLTYAAAMSRYFWPSKSGKNGIHKKRAEVLKKNFGLNEESPLKNRKLRNQLEHFDENLDNYLSSKPLVGYVLPAYVGGLVENDGVPSHLFRAFYIDVGLFEVLGVRHEVWPIVYEVSKIHDYLYPESNT